MLAISVLNKQCTVYSLHRRVQQQTTHRSCISGILVFTFNEGLVEPVLLGKHPPPPGPVPLSAPRQSRGWTNLAKPLNNLMETTSLKDMAHCRPFPLVNEEAQRASQHPSLTRRGGEGGGQNKPKWWWPFWVTGHLRLCPHVTDERTPLP